MLPFPLLDWGDLPATKCSRSRFGLVYPKNRPASKSPSLALRARVPETSLAGTNRRREGEDRMAYWLFKEEPDHYSFADLERDRSTVWEGVKNPLARNHLRRIRRGDRIWYYHTGKQKAIVGEIRAASDARSLQRGGQGSGRGEGGTGQTAGLACHSRGDQERDPAGRVGVGSLAPALRDARD